MFETVTLQSVLKRTACMDYYYYYYQDYLIMSLKTFKNVIANLCNSLAVNLEKKGLVAHASYTYYLSKLLVKISTSRTNSVVLMSV